MHSIPGWKLARRPNYITNKDKVYPYSEVPYLGEYNLVKIPISLNKLIEHVDYWGEGKIDTQHGRSGFSDCYNVNHTYQLVSNGPDRDRKIPNRIPVVNYTNCDTSSYIKDNSVITVTIMGAPINSSCAKDIARMVNPDLGRVVAYGFENSSQEIKNLITELKKKSLYHCPSYTLPSELQGLTLFDCDTAFLNLTLIKNELNKHVAEGSYDNAVDISKDMDNESDFNAISEVVTKLISSSASNIMAYAYKLWNNGGKEIVRRSFPEAIKLIFNGDFVTVVNEQYQQALKCDANGDNNDRLVLGDSSDRMSKRVTWKVTAVWENNEVTFELMNIDCNMYLKMGDNADSVGDRKVWGSTNETRQRYYLLPLMDGETLLFRIINCNYHLGLKMDEDVNPSGSRLLWGHNGDAYNTKKALSWIISANTKVWETEVIEILSIR